MARVCDDGGELHTFAERRENGLVGGCSSGSRARRATVAVAAAVAGCCCRVVQIII